MLGLMRVVLALLLTMLVAGCECGTPIGPRRDGGRVDAGMSAGDTGGERHLQNFLDCIRTNRRPNAERVGQRPGEHAHAGQADQA